jgi:ribosomal protein S19
MSRSKWKGPFFNFCLKKEKFKRKIYVWSRASVVPRKFVGNKVWVHNGRLFKTIFISREKVGFKKIKNYGAKVQLIDIKTVCNQHKFKRN